MRKMKRQTNKKFIISVLIVVVVMVALVGILIFFDQKDQKAYQIVQTKMVEPQQSYSITYNGETYDYNTSIETVLLIGVDSRGKLEAQDKYGVDARADNIVLVIMDRQNHRVKILPINRDTMTEITKYTKSGFESTKYVDHLGFAFTYGDGYKASCENTCDAISNLLYGINIRYYICTNLDSIAFANEMLGGVTVECPNDDLVKDYPELKKGSKVKLTSSNVEDFLRYRDTKTDYSNNGRMDRQQAFLDGFIQKAKTMSENDYLTLWDKINAKDSNILTNMSKAHFMNIIGRVADYDYEKTQSNLRITGVDKIEDNHDVFYPNKEELKQLVIDTFYTKR